MKLNISHKFQIILILICINLFKYTYASIQTDKKIIQIYSVNQTIDMLNNTIIFSGQVTLIYKNIDLQAEKILIFYTKKQHNLSMIKAYGNPVIIHQNQKTDHMIFAQSSIVHYDIYNNTVTFIDNAYITQSGTSIRSDNIIYSIKNKKIKAISNQGNQVITTLTTKSI